MAENFIGPYNIEIAYTVDSMKHKMNLNCRLDGNPVAGADYASLLVLRRDDTTVNLSAAVTTFVTLLAGYYSANAQFESVRVNSVQANSNIKQFLSAGTLSVAGSSGLAYVPAQQTTLTYITQEGGSMRLTFMESVSSGKTCIPQSTFTTGVPADLRDFIVSDANWILAKDTSYPVAALSWCDGNNNALERKRYR